MQSSQLNQISDHVYWLAPDETTDRPTLGVISGKNSTLVVDAGNSPAHAEMLLAALAKLAVAPLKYVVLTHWHWDHVFGTSVFDVPIIAQHETQRIVTEMAQQDWSDAALDERVRQGTEIEFCRDMIKVELPDRTNLQITPPDIAFESKLTIDLGGITCEIKHVGGDHAADSTIVHIPEEKIVFVSDCLYEDVYGARTYTPSKLFPLIDQILSYDANHYIFGHHDAPLTKAEMLEYMTLLRKSGAADQDVGDNQ